jgi:hypothetical protein
MTILFILSLIGGWQKIQEYPSYHDCLIVKQKLEIDFELQQRVEYEVLCLQLPTSETPIDIKLSTDLYTGESDAD